MSRPTVQLLVHGATYNHLYWNFPYGNGYYSYVGAATAAGYATFDIDRIGDGNSSHPPSSELALDAGEVALHDVVTALRSGAVDGHAFQHVIMVGHSIGSVEAWIEIARYHDVNAVIITGALHAISPDIGALESDLYRRSTSPAFAGSGLDPGYLTTLPGTRGSLFYDPATSNPAVVATDEADKDTRTPAELAGAAALISQPPAQQPSYQITLPVLSVVGQDDNLFCTAVTAYNCADPESVQKLRNPVLPAASAPESRSNPRHRACPRAVDHRPGRRRRHDRLGALSGRAMKLPPPRHLSRSASPRRPPGRRAGR